MHFRRQLPQRIKDAQQKAKLLEDKNAPAIIIFFFSYESIKSLVDKYNKVIDAILVSLFRYALLLWSLLFCPYVSSNRIQSKQPHG